MMAISEAIILENAARRGAGGCRHSIYLRDECLGRPPVHEWISIQCLFVAVDNTLLLQQALCHSVLTEQEGIRQESKPSLESSPSMNQRMCYLEFIKLCDGLESWSAGLLRQMWSCLWNCGVARGGDNSGFRLLPICSGRLLLVI